MGLSSLSIFFLLGLNLFFPFSEKTGNFLLSVRHCEWQILEALDGIRKQIFFFSEYLIFLWKIVTLAS